MQHLEFPSVVGVSVSGSDISVLLIYASSTAHRWFPSKERCRSQVSSVDLFTVSSCYESPTGLLFQSHTEITCLRVYDHI